MHHDIHLYFIYTNSNVFSDWRTVIRLHTANPIFPEASLNKQ